MTGQFSRLEPEVAKRYRKDRDDEEILATLNTILAPHQETAYRDLEEEHATLHIVGAPRSGTTLLNQLVCSCLDVGYVNHLIAAFWRAPVFGIRLSRKLLGDAPQSTYESEFGRTSGITEPHEFGYFWSSLLGYREPLQKAPDEDDIDWGRMRKVLLNMSDAFGRPAVYKSFYLGWHIERMLEVFTKACFVWIRRNPTQNALSLLKMRRQFLGSAEKWVSLKPREYEGLKDAPYWEQVAGQVYYLERTFAEQIARVGGRNVLLVRYEELCDRPRDVLERIRRVLTANGSSADYTNPVPTSFRESLLDVSDEESRRIDEAVARFYSVPIPGTS